MPIPIVENSVAISRIALTTNLPSQPINTVSNLYTVPVGRTLSVTHIAIKVNTATGTVTTAPALSIGSNAGTWDNLMATTSMIGATTLGRVFNNPVFGSAPLFPAGSLINVQVDTAQVGATSLIYDIELYGVLS